MDIQWIRKIYGFTGILLSPMLCFMNIGALIPLWLQIALPPIQLWLLFFTLLGSADGTSFCERLHLFWPDRKRLLKLTATGFLLFLALTAFNFVLEYTGKLLGLPPQTQGLVRFAKSCSLPMLANLSFMAVIFAPIVEESAFRHTAYSFLKDLPVPVSWGIPALIFAILHGFILPSITIFVLALFLQKIYCERESAIDSMLVHSMFNALNMICIIVLRFFAA